MAGFHDSTGVFRATVQERKQLPIFGFTQLAGPGTPLAAWANATTTVPGLSIDNSEAPGIRWNNDSAPAAVVTTLHIPDDKQPNTTMILHISGWKSGATSGDAVTFTVGAFLQPVATLHDADSDAGGATSAFTGAATAKTIQHVTRTIAAADIPNPTSSVPAHLSLTIKPTAGTLGTDDVTIGDVYLEYTKIVDNSAV